MARVVPCLSRNCTSVAAAADQPRELGQIAAAALRRIEQGIKAKIDHHDTRARSVNARRIEAVKRVEDGGRKTARPLGLLAGDLSGDAEDQQPGTGGDECVVLDRKASGDERGAGAAHGGNARHQRMAVERSPTQRSAVGDEIGCTGQRHDGAGLRRRTYGATSCRVQAPKIRR